MRVLDHCCNSACQADKIQEYIDWLTSTVEAQRQEIDRLNKRLSKRGQWNCVKCQTKDISESHVTFNERHLGCGGQVRWESAE